MDASWMKGSWDVIARTLERKLSKRETNGHAENPAEEPPRGYSGNMNGTMNCHDDGNTNGHDWPNHSENPPNTSSTAVSVQLSPNISDALSEIAIHQSLRTEPSDLVIAALALAAHGDGKTSGPPVHFIDIGNGRSGSEDATAIGFFDVLSEFNLMADTGDSERRASFVRSKIDVGATPL